VYNHNHLRLRRIGYREAEEKGDSEQCFLHTLSLFRGKSKYRATLTIAHRIRITKVTGNRPARPPRALRGCRIC
jgi:hypothetical protein